MLHARVLQHDEVKQIVEESEVISTTRTEYWKPDKERPGVEVACPVVSIRHPTLGELEVGPIEGGWGIVTSKDGSREYQAFVDVWRKGDQSRRFVRKPLPPRPSYRGF